MVRCSLGQVIKFQYRKAGCAVSSAQYKGRVISIIPNHNYACYDLLMEMSNAHIRRFHVRGIGAAKRVGIIERLIDWACGTSYRLPIA